MNFVAKKKIGCNVNVVNSVVKAKTGATGSMMDGRNYIELAGDFTKILNGEKLLLVCWVDW